MHPKSLYIKQLLLMDRYLIQCTAVCFFMFYFVVKLASQVLHVTDSYNSWTNSMCWFKYPFCVKFASPRLNWRGSFPLWTDAMYLFKSMSCKASSTNLAVKRLLSCMNYCFMLFYFGTSCKTSATILDNYLEIVGNVWIATSFRMHFSGTGIIILFDHCGYIPSQGNWY